MNQVMVLRPNRIPWQLGCASMLPAFILSSIPNVSLISFHRTKLHTKNETFLSSFVSTEEKMMRSTAVKVVANNDAGQSHPYAFHVSGPRNVVSPNWKDLIASSWKDGNYKRTVMACLVQAVYLLELDKQEGRTGQNALAPHWWLPFKYNLTKILVDDRDASIFGAVFEWDRSAVLSGVIPIRPSGAPKAVLALRGTLLKSQTIRRDVQDDLRFLAWETLQGSVRFQRAFETLEFLTKSYGSSNVSVAGHSLGAGFALQVGRALAQKRIYVETHLFNPPSFSIAMALKNAGEKVDAAWNRLKSILPLNRNTQPATDQQMVKTPNSVIWNWVPNFYGSKLPDKTELKRWVPYLYVNKSDYICCNYTDASAGTYKETGGKSERYDSNNTSQAAAKLFIPLNGKQKFMEAHGLEQWWSDDLEIQMVVNHSKLIKMQLQSLAAK